MIEEEIVYVRTDEGEAKAKQPRSISSHELRAMLLLIDGRLSVRELRRRFGKSLAIDKSIAELTKLGWVERDREHGGLELDLVDRKLTPETEDEATEESPETAREEISREAQARGAGLMSEPGKLEEVSPVLVDGDLAQPLRDAVEPTPESLDELNPTDESAASEPVDSVATDEEAPTAVEPIEEPVVSPEPDTSVAAEADVTPEHVAVEGSTPQRAEPVLDLTDADDTQSAVSEPRSEPIDASADGERRDPLTEMDDHADHRRIPEPEGPNIADRARGNMIAARFFLERLWRLVLPLAAVLAVVALVAAAFLLPERHRADVTGALERYFGSAVTVGDVRLSKDAGGSLAVERVTVARLPSVSIRSLNLVPDWTASLRAVKWRFRVQMRGIDGDATELASALRSAALDETISTVEFVDAGVLVGAERWGGYDGSLAVDPQSGERRVMLEGENRAVSIQVGASPDGLSLYVVGIQRPLPVFPQAKFDSYELRANMVRDSLTIESFGAAGYGGKIEATGGLVFAPVARLDAQVGLSKVDAARLMELAGSRIALGGTLDAQATLVASSEGVSSLKTLTTLEGTFSIDTGVLGRLDVGAAIRERGTGKLQGGETRFETMAGRLNLSDGALDVRITRLDAGALDANGRLAVARDDALEGRISAAVASGGRRISVPVTVSGTVTAPVLETPRPEPVVQPRAASTEASAEPVVPDASALPADEIPVVPGGLR